MKVLFICTANICRSPTAEGVFRQLVEKSALAGQIEIDSAGTHNYYVGALPDPRAIKHAAMRNIELGHIRARQISPNDFEKFDYVLAMDKANIEHLRAMCPTRLSEKIELLLDYGGPENAREVPDPYQGKARDFELALDLIDAACQGLLDYLLDIHRMRASAKVRPLDLR